MGWHTVEIRPQDRWRRVINDNNSFKSTLEQLRTKTLKREETLLNFWMRPKKISSKPETKIKTGK